MMWLNFIVEMTRALAWPVAVFALLLIFRSNVVSLLERLTRVKWADKEAAFELQRVKVAESIDEADPRALAQPLDDASRFYAQAQTNPRAAIIDMAIELEARIRDLAANLAPDRVKNMPAGQLIRLLRDRQSSTIKQRSRCRDYL
ncbi:MAG: hypothetical protein ISS15_06640 [Alphaproteobacteria bacterium]|nr:hypothetical protein [Alphaproteobacteria bacterium]MBL6938259.1 hypothetical protein [Alphaproteobacteria bacterium]MBL7097315.1 hypothetical protein [Alphaproteobacteria bacterium]